MALTARRMPLSGRTAIDRASDYCGERDEDPRVLVLVVPELLTQGPVHDRQGAARQALGARGSAGRQAKASGSQAREDAGATMPIEHVFDTLKRWMGSAHVLMKTLHHLRTEMSLRVRTCNLKRVISVLGIEKTMKAMRLAGA